MKTALRPLVLAASMSVVLGSSPGALADESAHKPTGLVRIVLDSTAHLRDPAAATDEGYHQLPSCVSGPEHGAMGVHFASDPLIEDGMLDAARPELLVYEPRPNGSFKLIAVEYLVLAEAWDAANEGPPVLEGQHFHYVGAPNRLGLPAFYELHVWAWKKNPHGMFVDWNPRVTCEFFVPES
jgi:hypothetical protein